MYKMIIADDEAIMRDSIKYIVDKKFPKIKIVCEVETGREAIEAAFEHVPHLMVMDIRMPGINGIDAIAEIKKKYPDIRFIIISAYDEFTYASEALKLGVDEFILKPIKDEQVINAIGKLLQNIEENLQKKKRELELQEKLNMLVPMLESEFVYALIFGDIDKIKKIDYPTLLGKKFNGGFCMIVNINDQSYPESICNELGKSYLNQKILDSVIFNLSNRYTCIISPLMSGKIVIFFSITENTDNYKVRLFSIGIAKRLIERIRKDTNSNAFIGIGDYFDNINSLTLSYKEALKAIDNALANGSIIHYGDVDGKINDGNKYPFHYEKVLCEKIRQGDFNGAFETFREFFIEVCSYAKDDIKLISRQVLELIIVISRMFFEYNIEDKMDVFLGGQDQNIVITFTKKGEIFDWASDKIKYISREIHGTKKSNLNNIIIEAVKYIDENYRKDMTLELVAKKVSVSPYYLSRLFKIEKNQNFTDYITNLRIEEAKKLFSEEKSISVKETCFKVGYNDPKYFSRTFKKVTGLTPQEYKEVKS